MTMSLRIKKKNSIVFFTQTRRKQSFCLDLMSSSICKDTKKKSAQANSKFVLYLCRWAEYCSAHVNEPEYSSGNENSDNGLGYSSGNENSDDILVSFIF